MKIKIALLWIVSLIFAYAVGISSTNNSKAPPDGSVETVSKIELENLGQKTIQHIPTQSPRVQKDKIKLNDVDEKDVISEVKKLLGNNAMTMDIASLVKSYNLILKLSEFEINNVLRDMSGTFSQSKNTMLTNLLVSRYAELNPYATIDFITNNISSPQAKGISLSTAISAWAKQDPSAAYFWTTENEEGKNDFMASYKYVSIFNGLAKQDLDDAFSKLNEMDSKGKNVDMAVMGLAGTLEDTESFTRFYENSKTLENGQVMTLAIRNWINKDPQRVTEWLNSVESGEDKTKMQDSALSGWLASEPENAAEWYMNESNEENRQASANKIVNSWGISAPKQALEWVNQQSDIDTELTTKNLIQSSVYLNAEFAMDNLSALNDENNKQSISRQIYFSLKRKNKKKAESFLNDSPYSEYILKKREKRRKK